MSDSREEKNWEDPFRDEVETEKKETYEAFIDPKIQYEHELKQKQDDFLDVYSVYLHVQDNLTRSTLKRKALELEILDPSFEFHLD